MQRNADENSLDVVFDEDPPGKEIPIGYLIGLGFATGSGSLTVFFFPSNYAEAHCQDEAYSRGHNKAHCSDVAAVDATSS